MAKYDIRLIASDIDGTLLPKGGRISEATRRAVAECRARGIAFVPASGRWYPSAAAAAREAGGADYLIVANGGAVAAPDGRILHEFHMRAEDVMAAYALIKDSGALVTSYVRGAIYRLNTASVDRLPPEKTVTCGGKLYEVVDDDAARFEKEGLSGVYKLETYSDDAALLARLRAALVQRGLSVSSSFRTNIEIVSPGMGKGVALRWLARRLGVPIEKTMAFGDNTNDLQSIEFAGVGVAMGDAADALKAAADEVTYACADDGVARFLVENVF